MQNALQYEWLGGWQGVFDDSRASSCCMFRSNILWMSKNIATTTHTNSMQWLSKSWDAWKNSFPLVKRMFPIYTYKPFLRKGCSVIFSTAPWSAPSGVWHSVKRYDDSLCTKRVPVILLALGTKAVEQLVPLKRMDCQLYGQLAKLIVLTTWIWKFPRNQLWATAGFCACVVIAGFF